MSRWDRRPRRAPSAGFGRGTPVPLPQTSPLVSVAEDGSSVSDSYGERLNSREREEARGGGLQGGVGLLGPGEEVSWGAVEGDGSRVHGDYPVGRGQAALQAVFGQKDRDPPLLVEAAEEPDELVARYRVELGGWLVEEDELGASDQGCRERYPL